MRAEFDIEGTEQGFCLDARADQHSITADHRAVSEDGRPVVRHRRHLAASNVDVPGQRGQGPANAQAAP